jgi:hypothetical protein
MAKYKSIPPEYHRVGMEPVEPTPENPFGLPKRVPIDASEFEAIVREHLPVIAESIISKSKMSNGSVSIGKDFVLTYQSVVQK